MATKPLYNTPLTAPPIFGKCCQGLLAATELQYNQAQMSFQKMSFQKEWGDRAEGMREPNGVTEGKTVQKKDANYSIAWPCAILNVLFLFLQSQESSVPCV